VRAAGGLLVAAAVAGLSAAAAREAPPGAASCSGCHGTEATAIPRLAGGDQEELARLLAAFRSGERPATVMDRIAKGFTPEEIGAIAAWLAAQR
jgi:cytochrome c553